MDKLVRKIIDKATGLVISGATVRARPKDVGATGDVEMVEIGTTGTYATASEIAHNTYGIVVNGTDSLDEATVEPGRVAVTKGDGSKVYPLIDRVADSVVVLSSFLADGDTSPTSVTLTTAISAATGSKPRTLVLDYDVTLVSNPVVSGAPLNLDLNGHTLTLSDPATITSTTQRIRVLNGKVVVGSSNCKIQGLGTNFIGVQFSGAGVASIAKADGGMTFDGCDGITALLGADGSGQTASVGGGSHGIGIAANLKLTDLGSTTGSERLGWLQDLVDVWYQRIIGSMWTAAQWLTDSRKSALIQWTSLTDIQRAAIIQSMSVANPGTITPMAKFTRSLLEKSVGVRTGIVKITPNGSSLFYMSGCVKCTITSIGAGAQITCTFPNSQKVGSEAALQWSLLKIGYAVGDPAEIKSHVEFFRITAGGFIEPVKFDHTGMDIYSEAAQESLRFYGTGTPTSASGAMTTGNDIYCKFDIPSIEMAQTEVILTSR